MTLNPTLQRATPSDLNELLSWISEFNAAEKIGTPLSLITPALKTLLADDSLGFVWFICVEGGHVGYVILTFGYDLEYAGRVAWITDFYLGEKLREQGLGTRALAAV